MKSPVLYLAFIALFAFSLSSCAEKGTASTKAGNAGGALYGSDAVAPTVKTQEEPVDNSPQTMVALETEYGTMKIRLYNNTPQHRDNFIKLATEGFFDDLLFHRVIKGFMIQGGDPESKGAEANARLGSGGPGYTVPAEINKTNWHIKGSLSAARQGDQVNPQRNSSGSQFYVVQGQGPMPESQMQGFKTRNPYSEQTLADYMSV
ncbi:MAG: cyclophilin family peptidyl-prolyl cis-trans isomerase, partial [Limisphaerales bacterium]